MAEPKVVHGRPHCVGRRKESVARVFLNQGGEGEITINGLPVVDYFKPLPFTQDVINQVVKKPFSVTNTMNKFDVEAKVEGGGYRGQLEALQHGISRALSVLGEEYKTPLKRKGLLTRDPRMVERKKYGRHKARRGQQFSKR